MRRVLLLLFLLPLPAPADSLAVAHRLHQNGLPHLALARVVRDQPSSPADPRWLEWESLRLTLLSRTGRPAQLIERVAALPADLPPEFMQKAHGHAAWAHLERGEGAAARAHLARLLWRFPLSTEDQKWARRLVIRSWLADHRPDEAYRAMLRYQQDFAPLGREVAAEFVQGLLEEGRPTEALTWLAELEPGGAPATRLALEAGLTSPEAALEAAQAALTAQPGDLRWITVLARAAERAGRPLLRIEALERLVAAGGEDAVSALWQAWLAQGESTGNRAQLLQGDDAAWLAVAEGLGPATVEARAVWAYLARKGREGATRERARAWLLASLVLAGREEAAVRVLEAAPWAEAKPAVEEGLRLAEAASGLLPEGERRRGLLAAARHAQRQGRFDLAADYAVQAVLASDVRMPDLVATRALTAAVELLEQAGLKEEALAFHRHVVGQRAPASRPPAPAGKVPRERGGKPETGRHNR